MNLGWKDVAIFLTVSGKAIHRAKNVSRKGGCCEVFPLHGTGTFRGDGR
jgi:hypothetical protein